MSFNNIGSYPKYFKRGMYANANPKRINDVKNANFNVG